MGTQTHPRLFSIFQPTPSEPGVLGSSCSHTHALTHTCTHAHTHTEPLRLPPPRLLPPPPLRLFCLRSLLPCPLTESAAKGGSKKFHSVREILSSLENLGKLTQGNRGDKRREDSSLWGSRVINKQNIQEGPRGHGKQSCGWAVHEKVESASLSSAG